MPMLEKSVNWVLGMQTKRQQVSMQVIKVARKLFANTAVHRLPLTTYIYRKVFHYGYSDTELVADFRGVKLSMPADDTTVVPGLVGGFYEEIELSIFEILAENSRTILDVGGSIGDYTCIGATRLPEGGQIIVFEPILQNIEYINKNLAQNPHKAAARVENVAIGDKDGEIEIYMVEGSVGTHSAAAKSAAGVSKKKVTVPLVSLDSYITKHKLHNVDILKVDVEGYDGFVLRGAEKLLKEQKPTLFIEFVSGNLKNCGFEPGEFVERLMSAYKHIYLVNEPKSTLKPCTKADLEYLAGHSMNANLVLSDNPEHLKLIIDWIKERN